MFLLYPLYRGDKYYKDFVTVLNINKYWRKKMPPSGFSQKAINGLLTFVESCYEDLQNEIREGKKKEGEALQAELNNIRSYLEEFKL
jgi:hypothetical protein